MLTDNFGEISDNLDFAGSLIEIAKNIVEDNYQDYSSKLSDSVNHDSFKCLCANCVGVITSYSIHYTKLYECSSDSYQTSWIVQAWTMTCHEAFMLSKDVAMKKALSKTYKGS